MMNAVKNSLSLLIIAASAMWAQVAFGQSYEWSPVMGEARALQRATKDLCRSIERTGDSLAVEACLGLSQSVCTLVELLDRDRCLDEIRQAQQQALVSLEATVEAVESNWRLSDDPRIPNQIRHVADHLGQVDVKISRTFVPLVRVPRWPRPYPWPVSPYPVYPYSVYPYPVVYPTPVVTVTRPSAINRQVIPLATSPGDWHQSNVPGYVSPGSWHHTNVARQVAGQ